MGAFIARQPNGLLCRFSSVVDCPTKWNMTDEDYLNNTTGTVNNWEHGQDILDNYMQPFAEVIEYFRTENMSAAEFIDFLIDVGYIELKE